MPGTGIVAVSLLVFLQLPMSSRHDCLIPYIFLRRWPIIFMVFQLLDRLEIDIYIYERSYQQLLSEFEIKSGRCAGIKGCT